MRKSVVAAAAAAAFVFSMGQAQAGTTLTASQVKALFPGSFQAVWKEKRNLTLNADADGGLVGSLAGGMGLLKGSGRWWTKGNQLCISFDRWKDEPTRCSHVVLDGKWYLGLHRENGKPRLRFRPI